MYDTTFVLLLLLLILCPSTRISSNFLLGWIILIYCLLFTIQLTDTTSRNSSLILPGWLPHSAQIHTTHFSMFHLPYCFYKYLFMKSVFLYFSLTIWRLRKGINFYLHSYPQCLTQWLVMLNGWVNEKTMIEWMNDSRFRKLKVLIYISYLWDRL